MDTKILDLVKDKKITDFADVIKAELKKKVISNDYIQTKAAESDQYKKVTDALKTLSSDTSSNEPVSNTTPTSEVTETSDSDI